MSIYFKDENTMGNASYENISNILMEFIDNSDIDYVTQGLNGAGFSCQLKDGIESPYSILSLDNSYNGECRELFIKLQVIAPGEGKKIYFDDSVELTSIYTIDYDTFVNEGINNLDIYTKSNNKLEPLCPPLIKGLQLDTSEQLMYVMNKLYKSSDNIDQLKIGALYQIVENNSNFSLGVSVFTYPDGYEAMSYILDTNNINNVDNMNVISNQRIGYFLILIIFELINLFDIGYLHNDIHMGNFLINPDYIYTIEAVEDLKKRGKCLIIDMGRVSRHEINPNGMSLTDKMEIIYQGAMSYVTDNIVNPYKWFKMMKDNPQTIVQLETLKNDVINYQEPAFSWIKNRYPNIINVITSIASDTRDEIVSKFSVLRGGNIKIDENKHKLSHFSQKENIIKNEEKSNNKITEKQIEKIVNPPNSSIKKIAQQYIRMLKDGINSVKTLVKKMRNSIKGGRRKNTRKNKKNKKIKSKNKSRKYRGGSKICEICQEESNECINVCSNNHYFDKDCIIEWCRKNDNDATCPICRESIKEICNQNVPKVTIFDDVEHNNIRLVRRAIEDENVNINILSKTGSTLLMHAIWYGNFDMVKYLIDNGININTKNDKGNTALIISVIVNSKLNIVQYLIGKGADINIQNNIGMAALHYATSEGNIKVVEEMVLNGNADLGLKNGNNETALDIAKKECVFYKPSYCTIKRILEKE